MEDSPTKSRWMDGCKIKIMSAAFENVTYDSISQCSNRNSLNFNPRIWVTASLYSAVRVGWVINKMILANNSSATRAEKNTRDHLRPKRARVYRVDVISSIAGYTTLPPTPFSGTLQKRGRGVRRAAGGRRWEEGERLMRATRERTNGRRAVRDFRTRT